MHDATTCAHATAGKNWFRAKMSQHQIPRTQLRFWGAGCALIDWERSRGAGKILILSAPLDFLDLVGLRAAGSDHLDAGALGLADQRTRERRGDGNLSFLGVG